MSKAAPPTSREQTLVKEGLRVVEIAASHISARFPGRAQPRELLAVGTFALYRAARRFDESLSHDFADYAYRRVRFAMLDSLRLESKRERRLRAAIHGADQFLATYRNDEMSVFDDDEVLQRHLREGVDALLAATFSAMVEEQQRLDAEDPVADHEEHRVACEALVQATATLSGQHQEVLALIYRERRTLEEASEALGLSTRTIQRRHAEALAALRQELGKRGVDRAPPPLGPSLLAHR